MIYLIKSGSKIHYKTLLEATKLIIHNIDISMVRLFTKKRIIS